MNKKEKVQFIIDELESSHMKGNFRQALEGLKKALCYTPKLNIASEEKKVA